MSFTGIPEEGSLFRVTGELLDLQCCCAEAEPLKSINANLNLTPVDPELRLAIK